MDYCGWWFFFTFENQFCVCSSANVSHLVRAWLSFSFFFPQKKNILSLFSFIVYCRFHGRMVCVIKGWKRKLYTKRKNTREFNKFDNHKSESSADRLWNDACVYTADTIVNKINDYIDHQNKQSMLYRLGYFKNVLTCLLTINWMF